MSEKIFDTIYLSIRYCNMTYHSNVHFFFLNLACSLVGANAFPKQSKEFQKRCPAYNVLIMIRIQVVTC